MKLKTKIRGGARTCFGGVFGPIVRLPPIRPVLTTVAVA
jgi:hypothetical protein